MTNKGRMRYPEARRRDRVREGARNIDAEHRDWLNNTPGAAFLKSTGAKRIPQSERSMSLGDLLERNADLEERIAKLTAERDAANEERSNLRAALAIAEDRLRKIAGLIDG